MGGETGSLVAHARTAGDLVQWSTAGGPGSEHERSTLQDNSAAPLSDGSIE